MINEQYNTQSALRHRDKDTAHAITMLEERTRGR